jgi:hypothetical protein
MDRIRNTRQAVTRWTIGVTVAAAMLVVITAYARPTPAPCGRAGVPERGRRDRGHGRGVISQRASGTGTYRTSGTSPPRVDGRSPAELHERF